MPPTHLPDPLSPDRVYFYALGKTNYSVLACCVVDTIMYETNLPPEDRDKVRGNKYTRLTEGRAKLVDDEVCEIQNDELKTLHPTKTVKATIKRSTHLACSRQAEVMIVLLLSKHDNKGRKMCSSTKSCFATTIQGHARVDSEGENVRALSRS